MGRQALMIGRLNAEAQAELETLYRQTQVVRLRTRAQIILLSAEKQMKAAQIAEIVRLSEVSVQMWLKRYRAEGINGLSDMPRVGGPRKVMPAYQILLLRVVRQRPRALEQPYSMWTLPRLADYLAEKTGIRLSSESVRLQLKAAEIVLSRPQHKISSPDPEYEVKKRRLKSYAAS
jgi:transposase